MQKVMPEPLARWAGLGGLSRRRPQPEQGEAGRSACWAAGHSVRQDAKMQSGSWATAGCGGLWDRLGGLEFPGARGARKGFELRRERPELG